MRLLAILVLLCSCAAPRVVTQPSDARDSVRMLVVDQNLDGETDGWCTAWAITAAHWVTAAHCVEKNGTRRDVATMTIAGAKVRWAIPWDGRDIAILSADTVARPLRLAEGPPLWGEPVHYIGFPSSEDFEPHFGVYSGHFNGRTDEGEIQFSAPVFGGASGSPLLNSDGEVIGVVVSSYRGTPYSYAEPTWNL